MLSGLVIFADDLTVVSDFYISVFDMHKVAGRVDHTVLRNTYMELVIHRQHASQLESSTEPLCSRQNIAIKPVFILPVVLVNVSQKVTQAAGKMQLDHIWQCGQ